MAGKKKTGGLGRGLDALFGEMEIEHSVMEDDERKDDLKASSTEINPQTNTPAENRIVYLDINYIMPNSEQPRKAFDVEKLRELASSIEEHGLIQPPVVRKVKTGYELVAGERRWRAARIAGLKQIPCLIRELTEEENILLAIVENMQREDLNPIEEAEGIRQMIETYGMSQDQVSKSVGKSRPYITNSLRLLKLEDPVKKMIVEGQITSGHARAIASIRNGRKQVRLAQKIAKECLSVRQAEELAKDYRERKASSGKAAVKDPEHKRIEEMLEVVLGTKININKKGKKGRIEIEFYSLEELERLIDLLKSADVSRETKS